MSDLRRAEKGEAHHIYDGRQNTSRNTLPREQVSPTFSVLLGQQTHTTPLSIKRRSSCPSSQTKGLPSAKGEGALRRHIHNEPNCLCDGPKPITGLMPPLARALVCLNPVRFCDELHESISPLL